MKIASWLRLHHALHNTPRTIHNLLKNFISPQAIFTHAISELPITNLQKKRLNSTYEKEITNDLKWLNASNQHHIITINDQLYPSLLHQIYDPPIILYVCGDPNALLKKQLAIVGSRNPTFHAQEHAFQFAAELSNAGLMVTSGLAMGIDGYAHQGALSVNAATVAVLGCGVNVTYPRRHRKLTEMIINNGAIVSEFPIDTQPHAKHFPRRNRIISGLSLGTLVVEATVRSGSLITANFAIEHGREVFAMPGSIRNPLTQGCHHLIKQGAILTQSVADILEEFNINTPKQLTNNKNTNLKELDSIDSKLLECLSFETLSDQHLIGLLGLTAQNVRSRLLNLELRGYIKAVPGGYCRVKL